MFTENILSRLRAAGARLTYLLVVLVGVSFSVYLLLDLLPGDTAEVLVASSSDPSPEAVDELRQELGLDNPLLVTSVCPSVPANR